MFFTVFIVLFFFFNDTATTEIYTLSLHDALPISGGGIAAREHRFGDFQAERGRRRSQEHTSELQSRVDLVCRLLLEKKKEKQGEPRRGCTQLAMPRDVLSLRNP